VLLTRFPLRLSPFVVAALRHSTMNAITPERAKIQEKSE
jgi:hypothetical protein